MTFGELKEKLNLIDDYYNDFVVTFRYNPNKDINKDLTLNKNGYYTNKKTITFDLED